MFKLCQPTNAFLLITFANSFVGPELDLNSLTLKVFLKDFFENVALDDKQTHLKLGPNILGPSLKLFSRQ